MYFSQVLLKQLSKQFNFQASVVGTLALDECTIPSKGRCSAITYIPNKPNKFRICMYTMVGWQPTYIKDFMDWKHRSSGQTILTQQDKLFGFQLQS